MAKEIMYKKRTGTSGIRGQLYETKLISLIHFRAKYNNDVKEYYLATNVDEIGAFDDICFKAKVKINDCDRSVAVFIQAKHREGDKVLTLNSKTDLAKYFDSYLNIRRAFKPGNKDVLFKGNFDETECLFVMYTTAKNDLNNVPYRSEFASKLNALISTGNHGLQPCYKDEEVAFLCQRIIRDQFSALAEQMAMFLSKGSDTIMSMNDDLILLYHVILAQKVFQVSDIKYEHEEAEHRIASFRQDFFKSNEDFLIIFKETLYIEILKNRKLTESKINSILSKFFGKPAEITILSQIIGNVIMYNSKTMKLKFVSKLMSDDLKRQLDKVNISQGSVDEAIELAAKHIIISRQFKVPAAFGNRDLTIRGKIDVNVENILDNLKQKMVDLIQDSPPGNVIVIDESLGDEFLQLNAGIASVIGNILISDENPKLMKFTDNCELLGDLAKRLFEKVQSEIQNLHKYRFHAKVKTLPKLSFDSDADENLEMIKYQVTALAKQIGKFICADVDTNEEKDNIMTMNELMLRYHVILVQTAIEVSEIQCRNEDKEYRIAKFRQDFFESNEEILKVFRDALYTEILTKRKLEDNEINSLLSSFFDAPSELHILSKLIGTVIMYDNGKFEIVNFDVSVDLKQQLHKVNIPQATVDEAVKLAAKEILTSIQFKVSASFGNKDLTVRGNKGLKIESRLKHLKMKFVELINNSKTNNNIVTFDESLGDGLLKLSGGIAGVVGNMLVVDENTKLMKFTDNWESLEELSRRLYAKLQSAINNLHEYKFDIKVKKFPKLSFESSEHDENLVKVFLSKLLFYTNQADEHGVEELLRKEIEEHQRHTMNNSRATSNAIFLKYHDEIQKWWMLPQEGSYLTKKCRIYENALKQIVTKPQLTVMKKMLFELKYN